MNENIMAMVAELESNFPIKWEQHDKIKDLHFKIYDDRGYKFGIDKEFNEKRFDYMRFYYKGEKGEIYTLDETECIVRIPDKMSWEEFRGIGAILSITSKYMNSIKFNKMSELARVWKYDK
ncbi:hypothetical protein [Ligilactobacillus salivarius]|uniref:Uncharacterized protein n=2 Tax=Ligilactobacillus salivarius TaxID=1624 RepID=A0JQD1_LIGS1|nr:hypothetical protein [Ligilactobacillus salivarius]ABD99081.1 Hypothetical protein, phage associated [Ligilactobacillus salivarius UCC118]OQR21928.1 hypothetical protein B6U40_01430 [Ligilactobacillus salivarius]